MNFTDATKVLNTIQATDDVAFVQGENRAKINQLFNGAPLLSETDAKKLSLRINCNLGEAPVLGQHGRRQYQSAFLSRNNFFSVRIPDAPVHKRTDWESYITRLINKPLKSSLHYFELQRAKWAAVLLHGYAPSIYEDRNCTMPNFVALEDFRVPTDTRCDLSNLQWFAVRKPYTEGELARKVWGKYADPGWKKPLVKELLETVHDHNTEDGETKWSTEPEKMAELIKQNGGFYAGDAVPTIPLFHFYFLDDSNPRRPEWRMRVVPDTQALAAKTEFYYDNGKTSIATKREHLIQMQFGDLSSKPPFLIHSVRSMGFLLMEPIFHSNLLQCRFLQHVHEHMNAWLRVADVQAKQRAQKIDLYHMGIVPDGVSVVPNTERHNINPELIQMGIERMDTLKQQASVSYTQDSEGGSERKQDETATAVMARVSQVNAMMSGLLLTARQYEQFGCEEIARRFCLRNTDDEMAKAFQAACRKKGIPSVFLNPEMWDVEVEMPLGNGNPTMEMAQAQALMQNRAAYSPTAQQQILHEFTIAVTGDPRKANDWVPVGKERPVNDAMEHAELAFSTLMLGVPVRQREGLPLIDQIETILGLISGVIARIEKTGNMARMDEIMGLQNAAQYVGQQIQQLGGDDQEKQRAKQYSQVLGKLMNAVTGFQQRLQEAQKKAAQQQNGNGEAQAKAQADMMVAQAKIQGMAMTTKTKMQLSEASTRQKLQHKEQAFQSEQSRRNVQAGLEERRKNVSTVGEEGRKDASTVGDIHRGAAKTHAEIKNKRYAAYKAKDD